MEMTLGFEPPRPWRYRHSQRFLFAKSPLFLVSKNEFFNITKPTGLAQVLFL